MRRAPVIVSVLAAISGGVVVLVHWSQYLIHFQRLHYGDADAFNRYWTHQARHQVWSTPPDYWRDLARGGPSHVEALLLLAVFALGLFVVVTGRESLVARLRAASTLFFRAALIVIVLGAGASARELSTGLARAFEVPGRAMLWDLYPHVAGPPATIRITAVFAGTCVSLALALLLLAIVLISLPVHRGKSHE